MKWDKQQAVDVDTNRAGVAMTETMGTSEEKLRYLRTQLHRAMQLEHATIPPYLMALYSLKPGSNLDAQNILRVIVVEEMLHLTLAANLLNAVGGLPDLTVDGFVPRYPAPLPDGETAFTVNLAPFSPDTLETFLKIESPVPPAPDAALRGTRRVLYGALSSGLGSTTDEKRFATIGEFYRDIEATLNQLYEDMGPDRLFTGAVDRQVTSNYYYSGGGELFPVTDIASANRAIQLIVQQGEGYTESVHDAEGEIAHYYRFYQLKVGRYYQRNDPPDGPSGPPLDVDWEAVFPVGKNLSMDDYRHLPEVRHAAAAFNESYGSFLRLLTDAFNGRPQILSEAVPMMFRFRDKFLQLVHYPLPDGRHAAPTFEIGPRRCGP